MSKTDNDFMKFMEDEYGVKFIDAKVEDEEKPKEPPPLPQAWGGMYQGRKRDAKYYEMCLKDLRDTISKYADESKKRNEDLSKLFDIQRDWLDQILAHEYELDGVDLDKPNYGMFE